MSEARILHVDDEPDIREVVRISLGLDPELTVRSCASGAEGLAVASGWMPDLILLDVMMPDMDGPATLAKLCEDPRTSGTLVVFMTARAQARELDYFKSLGAAGIISKPFDPIALAKSVREFLRPPPAGLEALQEEFLGRAARDAGALAACSGSIAEAGASPESMERLRKLAHGLAGAAGIFGFAAISDDAAALEELVIAGRPAQDICAGANKLIARIRATPGLPGRAAAGTEAFALPSSRSAH